VRQLEIKVLNQLKYFQFNVEQVQEAKPRTSRLSTIGDICCKSGRRRKSVLLPRPLTPHGKLSRWQTQGVCQPHQIHHVLWLPDWRHSPRQFPFSTTDILHRGSSWQLYAQFTRQFQDGPLSLWHSDRTRHSSQF